MQISPAIYGYQAGAASGGGDDVDFLPPSALGALGGVGQDDSSSLVSQSPSQAGDGSVGLFDGVLKKALLGGSMGAMAGFLPFIPGGPLLGGVVGALAGAGFGVFKNYMAQKQIKNDNAAKLAALGVQPGSEEEAAMLLNGQLPQVGQLPGQVGQVPGQTPVQDENSKWLDHWASTGKYDYGQTTQTTPPVKTDELPPTQTLPPVVSAPPEVETAPKGGKVDQVDPPTKGNPTQHRRRALKHRIDVLQAKWDTATPAQREKILERLQEVRARLEALITQLKAGKDVVPEIVDPKGGSATPPPVTTPPVIDPKGGEAPPTTTTPPTQTTPPVVDPKGDTDPPVTELPPVVEPPASETPPADAPPADVPPIVEGPPAGGAPPTDVPTTDDPAQTTPPVKEEEPPVVDTPPVKNPVQQAPTQTAPKAA